MKKTIKIAVVILFLLMALGIGFLVAMRIINAMFYAKLIIHQGYENAGYIVTVFWETIADISHKIVAFILLIVNAFFIMFDFYFQVPLSKFQLKMKNKLECKKRLSAERKKQRLEKKQAQINSKLKNMESDE